jgi:hypothetical protein
MCAPSSAPRSQHLYGPITHRMLKEEGEESFLL